MTRPEHVVMVALVELQHSSVTVKLMEETEVMAMQITNFAGLMEA
jgi:hypothetical protein